jgi:hypothetical protein
MPQRYCIYDPGDLFLRLDTLASRMRAQGGMSEAGEYPSRTEIIEELARVGVWLVEHDMYTQIAVTAR